jgi:Fe-Mn family superoxide dismutase
VIDAYSQTYPFKLPELPYTTGALEPDIDAKTMEIHHGKHHATYVEKLNAIIEKHPELQGKTLLELVVSVNTLPAEIRQGVINHGGGHINHSLFWEILKAESNHTPDLEIARALQKDFSDLAGFQKKFTEVATNRFGSGWAWLVLNAKKELEIISTANQDSPFMDDQTPLLGLDVWEHAYYLKYQNRRPEYIQAWWKVVNWEKVNELFVKA